MSTMPTLTLREGTARPRVDLGVDLRKTSPGARRHRAIADHVVSVHTGAPTRISCAPSGLRAVRSRGHINVLPAGITEDWFEDDASDTIDLRMPAPLLSLAAEEMGLDPARAALVPRCHVRDARIEHIAWALAAEHRESSPNGLLYRESLGLALAVHLLSHHRAKAERRAALSPVQVARLIEYIDAHLGGDVSLGRLARVAGVSASHLGVLSKRSLGVPVHELVIQRRVERARSLILEGGLPLSEVALEAGFSHQSHMARCVRRVLGITPSAIVRSRA